MTAVQLDDFQATSERLADGTFVVSVVGELDLFTSADLDQALLAADGATSVVVELSRCTFIDSAALGVLVAARHRLGTTHLSVVATSVELLRTFELTGLDRLFPFHESLTAALGREAR